MGCRGALSGADARRRLFGQSKTGLVEQQAVVVVRLRVARQDEFASVRCGQVDVHHLEGGELLDHRARSQAGRMGSGHVLERDEQAVADEGKEHVCLDALVEAVEHRAHRERSRLSSSNACSTSVSRME